jgi:beta-lactamase superfamily II metal-dependent hydrolase
MTDFVNRNKTEFKILKAFNGDCILIKTFTKNNKEFIILIDGGTPATFKQFLKDELLKITKIDLLILTHIDSDHIGGLINFFKNSLIDKIEISQIWINHPELIDLNSGELISFNQANSFKNLIKEKKSKTIISSISTSNRTIDIEGIEFTILSPTAIILENLIASWQSNKSETINTNISAGNKIEDYKISFEELCKKTFQPASKITNDLINASSISFVLKCFDISILFLADSRAEIIVEELTKINNNKNNPISIDYVKISHHGSKNNTSSELLEMVNCSNYIISTNGGSTIHRHPSRETISKIVFNNGRDYNKPLSIFTNYSLNDIKNKIGNFITDKDLEKGNWSIEHKNNF